MNIGHKRSTASFVCEVELVLIHSQMECNQIRVGRIVLRTVPSELVAGSDASSISVL